MRNLTRRNFLQTIAGAAASGAMIAPDDFLYSEMLATGNGQNEKAKASDLPLQSLIFPGPREISGSGSDFVLDSQANIVVPSNPSEQDLFLATSLANELSDRFGLQLKIERVADLNANRRNILMGSMKNPLVRKYCADKQLTSLAHGLVPEGYILRANKGSVLIAGIDDVGAFYGLQSLRQLIASDKGELRFHGAIVQDWPDKPYRGISLYVPGRENIPFFKRFIRDFVARYKFNTVIMEMNACMRLDGHPELNYGWVQFARDTNYSARNYPPGPFHDMEQNSSHQDCGDGSFLEKEEVADLVRWVRRHHIELVPEIASFTHSYYLLTEHRDLAAVPQNKWPDIYCPSNPKSYSLVYEVYDEYIDVFQPKTVHIGHDELFLPVGVSAQCKDDDIGELYGQDVKKIHDHLASKGIQTALWGDMLLQSVRGVGLKKKTAPDGWTYYVPGGLTPEQVERLIPKDCLIYNWFWSDEPGKKTSAEVNEAYLDKMGFLQIYGNFEPNIENYETRKKRSTLLGGAPSAWYATNEIGFGKDFMASFLGCGSILWTGHTMAPRTLSAKVQSMVPAIRVRMSGIVPPSQTETSIVPVDISSRFNFREQSPVLGGKLGGMTSGTVQHGKVPFNLQRNNGMQAIAVGTKGKGEVDLPASVTGIPVGVAPTSLIFLHASARPAKNRDSVRLIWDRQDTADLLGWYEVVYEDEFVTTIPIRYGVNILEWNWDERVSANDYCYGADALAVGDRNRESVTFFAYEWINPRLGKTIREIRLKGTSGFRGGTDDFNNDMGPVIASNAVILAALSYVKKRG